MINYISRRLLYAAVILLLVSMAVYAIFQFLPFDPAALTCGKNCRPNLIAANRVRLGFDKPFSLEYLSDAIMEWVRLPFPAQHPASVTLSARMPA